MVWMYVLIDPRVKAMMSGEPPIMFLYLRPHPIYIFFCIKTRFAHFNRFSDLSITRSKSGY